MFYSKKPKSIHVGDRLIYYAVGGTKRIVAEAEVTGEASQDFTPPADWTIERHKRFSWRMPVRLLSKCAANAQAPLTSDYYPNRITAGSFRSLTDEQGLAMSDAIRNASAS